MLVSGPDTVSVLVARLGGGQTSSGQLPVLRLPGLAQLAGDGSGHLDWTVAVLVVAGGEGEGRH